MADYTATGNPDIINKAFTGSTTINIQDYIIDYLRIKDEYISDNIRTKEDATILYNELKPIYDAGLLPAKYNNEFQELENFIT